MPTQHIGPTGGAAVPKRVNTRPRRRELAAPPDDRARAAKGGAIAGIVGGLVVALFLMIVNAVQGNALAPVFKLAALPLLGLERVASPAWEPGIIALGVVLHLLVSAGWGVLFGLLFYGLSRAGTLAAGLFWGLVVWVAMFYVLLPLVGGLAVSQTTPLWQAIVMHLVFGLTVALTFLPFQRKIPRQVRPLERGRVVDVTDPADRQLAPRRAPV